jgi:putative acetyltransferase
VTRARISIRPECRDDASGVRETIELAFGRPDEARIVDAVRGSADAISLVATVVNQVVGHILFTPVSITPEVPKTRIAGLAPLAVRPEFQRQGIGGQLIRAGLVACRRLGYTAVVVVGHPKYYPRFGFVQAHSRGLEYEEPLPREVFMVIELEADALAGHAGVVHYLCEFTEI